MSNPTPEKTSVADALREWGFDVKAFEARAKKSLDTARGDLTEINGAVRQTLTQTKEVLVNLQKQRKPVAAELEKRFASSSDRRPPTPDSLACRIEDAPSREPGNAGLPNHRAI